MATETLKRLSRCLDLCTTFFQQGDLPNCFDSLMNLRRNMVPFFSPSELTEVDALLKTLPKNWLARGDSGRRVLPMHYGTAHKILDDVYTKIIVAMKAQGLLMPKSSDPRAAVISN